MAKKDSADSIGVDEAGGGKSEATPTLITKVETEEQAKQLALMYKTDERPMYVTSDCNVFDEGNKNFAIAHASKLKLKIFEIK